MIEALTAHSVMASAVPATDAPRQSARIKPAQRHYDAAQTTRHNTNHWAHAATEDANSLIGVSLATLRNRARYEVRNNPYAKGILETLADDIVGESGPRLQIESKNPEFNKSIEREFRDWSDGCDIGGRMSMGDLLRLSVFQFGESGESVTIKRDTAEGFRLLSVEPDVLTSPAGLALDNVTQGIKTDSDGRPVSYCILKEHPGKSHNLSAMTEYTDVPAANVYHCFRVDRPGQFRGVPWLTPALPLFAQLRRYTAAVITAAETAADLSAVVLSNSEDLSPVAVKELDEFEIQRNTMLTLPVGWDMKQFKAEHPTTTFPEFVRQILMEIARCVCMPVNVAMCDSSKHNFASGRLDWKVYYRHICTLRGWLERSFLNPIFRDWLKFERLTLAGSTEKSIGAILPRWFWPGQEPTDPLKAAQASSLLIEKKMQTLSEYKAEQGRDWEEDEDQLAREAEKRKVWFTELQEPITHEAPQAKTEESDPPDDDDDATDADASDAGNDA